MQLKPSRLILSLSALALCATAFTPAQAKQAEDKQVLIDEVAIGFASVANQRKQSAQEVERFTELGRCLATEVANSVPDSVFEKYDMHDKDDNKHFLKPLLDNRDKVEKSVARKCKPAAQSYVQQSKHSKDAQETIDYLLNTLYANYEQADYDAKNKGS